MSSGGSVFSECLSLQLLLTAQFLLCLSQLLAGVSKITHFLCEYYLTYITRASYLFPLSRDCLLSASGMATTSCFLSPSYLTAQSSFKYSLSCKTLVLRCPTLSGRCRRRRGSAWWPASGRCLQAHCAPTTSPCVGTE